MKQFIISILTGLAVTLITVYAIFLGYMSIMLFKNLSGTFGLVSIFILLSGILFMSGSIFLIWFIGQGVLSIRQNNSAK